MSVIVLETVKLWLNRREKRNPNLMNFELRSWKLLLISRPSKLINKYETSKQLLPCRSTTTEWRENA